MTLGRLVYLAYHRPVGCVKRSIREGGPIEQWKTERGRREMEAAAWRLPSIAPRDLGTTGPLDGGKPVEVQVLTGRKFWYQTAFCLHSFALASGREVRAVIHDDGSLDPQQAETLLRFFPGSRVETRDMIIARLDELLPAARFPTLRARRLELPLIKKITDIHLGRTGWRVFFDADLLFFRRPDLFLEWWDDPRVPLTSVDAAYAYGYSMALLNEVAGKPVYDFINTGLLGLKSDAIDWEKMEHWCRTLIERAGTDYYQEQALVALQVAGSDRVVLPREDYLVYPRGEEAARCRAVMHHYVDLSKTSYFRDNWRRFASSS
jgi:hypothetical protein